MTLATLTGALQSGALAEPLCEPAVTLTGDEDLVRAVAAVLRERGIATAAAAYCLPMPAVVTWSGALVHVQIDAAKGPHAERNLSTPTLAATFIESLVRQDISEPLLRALHVDTPEASLPPPQTPASPPPAPPPAAARPVVALAAEVAVASDTSVWVGGSAAACVRWRVLCVGGRLHLAAQVPDALAGVSRLDTQLLAALSFPLQWRRVTLQPGLDVGLGWIRTSLDSHLVEPSGITIDHAGLRLGGNFHVAIALGWGLAVEAGVDAQAQVFSGSSLPLAVTADVRSGNETFGMTIITVSPPPWGWLRAGLGLRWSHL